MAQYREGESLRWKAFSILLLIVTVSLIYTPHRDVPFQFDDHLLLRDDNVQLGRWSAFLLPPSPRFLTWLTFLVQFQIHGPDPVPLHLVNFGIHAINAVLVFFILSLWAGGSRAVRTGPSATETGGKLFFDGFFPLFGAMIFACHPLQTETVLYLYQRSTLLATCFLFSTLIADMKGRRVVVFVFFTLALASKEFAVVLPAALYLQRGFLQGRWRPDRSVISLALLAAAAGVAFISWIQIRGETTLQGGWAEILSYALTQIKVVWFYIGLAAFPFELNLDREIIRVQGFGDPLWWPAVLLSVGLAVLIWRRRGIRSPVTLSVLTFLIWLLPTSSLIPSQDLMFEHRTYASMLGWSGLAAFGFRELRVRASNHMSPIATRTVSIVLAITLISLFGLAADRRSDVWSDPVRLWRDTVAKSPGKYRPNYNLGVLLIDRDPKEAAGFLSRAVQIDPTVVRGHQSLGEAYFRLGELDRAERSWQMATRLSPDDPASHTALGRVALKRRNFQSAKKSLDQAIELDPEDWRPRLYMAQLHLSFGFVREAIEASEKGLNLNPAQIELRLTLADAVRFSRNWPRAAELYREVLDIDSESSRAYLNLARTLAALGDLHGACGNVEKGVETARNDLQRATGQALAVRYSCPVDGGR